MYLSFKRRALSVMLICALLLSSISISSAYAFAESGNYDERSTATYDKLSDLESDADREKAKEILNNNFAFSKLSKEASDLYVAIIRESLENEGVEPTCDNVQEVIQILNDNEFVEYNEKTGEILISSPRMAKAKVKLKTKTVAAVLNVAISVALVALGGAAGKGIQALVKDLIKKYGKKHAKKLIVQKVTSAAVSKLVSLGIRKKVATGIATFITNCILDYADPGGQIAKYLDKKDGKLDGYITI